MQVRLLPSSLLCTQQAAKMASHLAVKSPSPLCSVNGYFEQPTLFHSSPIRNCCCSLATQIPNRSSNWRSAGGQYQQQPA
jgi:hypothetical protein